MLPEGSIPQMEKGDVLGHECCGVVESVGPESTKVKVGERVVVSFPIACGSCRNCKREFFSQCDRTNENTLTNALYGKRTAGMLPWLGRLTSNAHAKTIGMFGYSHFTGGFAGGQAEYLRVPYGDVNLLSIPD